MRSGERVRVSITAAVLVAVALLSTGCTGSDPEESATTTVTVLETNTETATPTTAPTTATVSSSSTPDPDIIPSSGSPSPVSLRMRSQGATYFQTPSGNIGCFLLWYGRQRSVECSLKVQDFANPPRPADCDLDWAPQFNLTKYPTYGGCRGDVSGPPTDVTLPYGTVASNGSIECESRETGLTCSNLETDHGFELSRASYRLF